MFGDLCFAVWVCKKNWGQILKGIADSDFMRDIRFLRFIGKFRNKNKAMVTPFGEAVYDLAAIGEAEGVCGFVMDEHTEAGEAAKRQWERRQEEIKTNGKRN